MSTTVTLDDVVNMVRKLSVVDKIRLIEQIAPQIERDIQEATTSRKSLRGLWQGLDITSEEIDEMRRKMWADFPREDI